MSEARPPYDVNAPGAGGSAPVIVAWLAALYDDVDAGWLTLFSIDRATGDNRTDWFPVDDYEALAERALERAASCCVWFGVATRKERKPKGRGKADDCDLVPAFWVDLDIAGPGHKEDGLPDAAGVDHILASFELAPSFVVNSGHGLQAWWVFQEPLSAAEAAPLLDRWSHTWKKLGGPWRVDSVFNVDRVMRLPGTLNRKLDPVPVVITVDSGLRYGADDIEEATEAAPEAPQRPKIAPRPHGMPGDALNDSRTVQQLLLEAGWTLHHSERNGDEHWTRPGKNKRDGTSATVFAEDNHLTLWSDTAARQYGMEVRRPYDAFGVYTHFSHGGDFRAASDSLAAQGVGAKPQREELEDWIVGKPTEPASEPESEPDEDEPADGDSWKPTDVPELIHAMRTGLITRPVPTLGTFTNGKALWYPGRINAVYGEPGQGKTWIALAVAAEALKLGQPVAWIDMEEPAEGILWRLGLLGVADHQLEDHFLHFQPDESITLARHFEQAVTKLPPVLVVIDSTGEALSLEGLNSNKDDEVTPWFKMWPGWIAKLTGAGIVLVDHVIKDRQTRGFWASGSQRKLARLDGHAIMVDGDEATAINPGKEGRLSMYCAKDRSGTWPRGQNIGEFVLDATEDAYQWRFEPKSQRSLLQMAMRKVCALLTELSVEGGWVAPSKLGMLMPGGLKEVLEDALRELLDAGCVEASESGKSYRLLRSWSDADEALKG